jgi:hypothetical protein
MPAFELVAPDIPTSASALLPAFLCVTWDGKDAPAHTIFDSLESAELHAARVAIDAAHPVTVEVYALHSQYRRPPTIERVEVRAA